MAKNDYEKRIVSLQNDLELAHVKIQMLNLQIEINELEKQLSVMESNRH